MLTILKKTKEGTTDLEKIMYSKEMDELDLTTGPFFALYEWADKIVKMPKKKRRKLLKFAKEGVSASDKMIEFWKRTII